MSYATDYAGAYDVVGGEVPPEPTPDNALTDLRAKAAAALAPVADSDPAVHVELVDALDPPCLLLTWGEPWLDPHTACTDTALLVVVAIAGRLEPGPGVATLERLVIYVRGRMTAAPPHWPRGQVGAPRRFDMAGVTYLAARIEYRVNVTT